MNPAANPWTWLATLNASLNAVCTVLLLWAGWEIRRAHVDRHKWLMCLALGASVLFLASYLVYHAKVGSVPFRGSGWIRGVYLAILLSHVVLAALIPFMALRTFWLGWKDRRAEHRWWARITYPLWLYVSGTGVLIYLLVYHY